MENNIENKIKEVFKNREIKPSKNTWEVLNAQLEVTTTKKENKKLKFLAYAAVFIGLLFGLITFINSNKTVIDKPIIVDVNKKDKVETPINKNQITNIYIERSRNKSKILTPKVNSEKNEIVINKKTTKIKRIKRQVVSNFKVVSDNLMKEEKQEIIKKQNITEETQLAKVKLPTINSNVINELGNKPKSVKKKLFTSDKDIDLMLATALNNKTTINVKKIKIQTAYLQYSVESEIKTPIGNKILKTLKAGVDTVEEYITSNN